MSETAGQIKARHVGEQPFNPEMRLVSQSDVDKLRKMAKSWHKKSECGLTGRMLDAQADGIDVALFILGLLS